jgi:proline iminopeptidase
MRSLFPEIQPNNSFMLDVGDGHSIYVEECGNPDGIPVVFCHGGPGGGCSENHRRYYDPERYRIVLFDQRGCGRSTPNCADNVNGLWHNTTQHLVADMEKIREHLNIKTWLVTGGSWGTTLALMYAIKHAAVVSGLILRGVFLGRQQDLEWLFSPTAGASQLFPDYYKEFIAGHPTTSVNDLLDSFFEKLSGDNDIEQLAAAKKFCNWEHRILQLNTQAPQTHVSHKEAIASALIYCHYFTQHCFIYESEIMSEIGAIQHIPGYIVHGRYDVVCKAENATTLHEGWKNSVLDIVPMAGHSSAEPGIIDGLVRASQKMADFIEEKQK